MTILATFFAFDFLTLIYVVENLMSILWWSKILPTHVTKFPKSSLPMSPSYQILTTHINAFRYVLFKVPTLTLVPAKGSNFLRNQNQYWALFQFIYISVPSYDWPVSIFQMVPRHNVGEGGGAPDHGEGQERLVPGARVARASRRVRTVRAGARPRQPRHDPETGERSL